MVVRIGTDANETLRGTRGADILDGRGGDDRVLGRRGDDVLLGGPGANLLDGGPGRDAAGFLFDEEDVLVRVLSGLAPLPLADASWIGYRAAPHRGGRECGA